MDVLNKLYDFVDLAEKNRKYPANTAHGRRAALKLFETVLHPDELGSLALIEERMKEIYLSLISKHKDNFSVQSLNTYKGRFLKVIADYKRYGEKPEKLVQWEAKHRKYTIKDRVKDTSVPNLSFPVHRGVHKLEILLEGGESCSIEAPSAISKKDAQKIKDVLDALAS